MFNDRQFPAYILSLIAQNFASDIFIIRASDMRFFYILVIWGSLGGDNINYENCLEHGFLAPCSTSLIHSNRLNHEIESEPCFPAPQLYLL